jgi:hypothetical protein
MFALRITRCMPFRLVWWLFLCSLPGFPQEHSRTASAPKPEIHGSVIEPGTLQPVGEAQVLIFKPAAEFALLNFSSANALAQTTTDANGKFRFSVARFGSYRVEVKKEGYRPTASFAIGPGLSDVATVNVTAEHPIKQVHLMLARPGQVSGRLVDEETRKPIAKMQVWLDETYYTEGRRVALRSATAVTSGDGTFLADGLTPGDYAYSGEADHHSDLMPIGIPG